MEQNWECWRWAKTWMFGSVRKVTVTLTLWTLALSWRRRVLPEPVVGHFRHTDYITHSRTVLMQRVAVSVDFYGRMPTITGSCALERKRKKEENSCFWLWKKWVKAQPVSSCQQSSTLMGPFARDAINVQWEIITCGDAANRCKIQTHKSFKRTLYIRTKHNVQIFRAIPFITLQNDA